MPNVPPKNARSSSRVHVAVCIGYGLLLLSSQLTIWGGLRISEHTGFSLLPLLTWWSVPLLAAIGISLLALGAFALLRFSGTTKPARQGLLLERILPCVACALTFIGFGLFITAPPASQIFVCSSALALGLGTGTLFVAWTALFAQLERREVTALVLSSLIVSALPLIVLPILPLWMPDAVFVIATFGSTALFLALPPMLRNDALTAMNSESSLSKQSTTTGSLDPFPEERIEEAPLEQNGFGWRPPKTIRDLAKEAIGAVRTPLFCASVIAVAVAITRLMTLNARPESSAIVSIAGAICMIIGAAALIVALYGRRAEKPSALTIPTLFRILFPVVATLLLILSIGGDGLGAPAGAAVFAIYMIMAALMVPACIDSAQRKNMHPAAVYGLFAGIVYAVFAIATFFGVSLFSEESGFGAATSFVATLLVFYVLAMAFALMQRRTASGDSSTEEQEGADRDDNGASASDSAASATPAPDPIEQRCLAVVEQYGLSQRETDVLMGFAHGRTVMHLADSLCLSPNTVRSHCKTLYTKLGIHSRQELIDLVDAVEAPEASSSS